MKIFSFLDHLIIRSDYSTGLEGFGEIEKSKMADQDGQHCDIMMISCHVALSSYYADLKESTSLRTIYPPSVIVITLAYLE